ncbi:MAG: hypothetical protein ACLRSW_09440 [Christensenellaceae bacterium]
MLTLTKRTDAKPWKPRNAAPYRFRKTRGAEVDKTNAYFGSITWVISNLLSGVCLFLRFLAIKTSFLRNGSVQSLFGSINGSVLTLINAYPALMSGKEAVSSLSELMRAEDMEGTGGNKVLPAIEGRGFDNMSIIIPTVIKS